MRSQIIIIKIKLAENQVLVASRNLINKYIYILAVAVINTVAQTLI